VSEPNSEYAEVTDMLRRLTTLVEGSIEYHRQRDVIVQRCLPLADHIAHRFGNRGEPLEDLFQVARVGLINAVNRFDADKGVQFVAFAVPTIMGEVRRYFRDHGWSVKVPRRLKELSLQLKKAHEELSHQLGRAPTPPRSPTIWESTAKRWCRRRSPPARTPRAPQMPRWPATTAIDDRSVTASGP
jgi:RNA polymerase sigma-B factor